MLGSVLESVLRAYFGADSQACWEVRVLESMPGSELENVLGGVHGSVLGVYLGVS